MEKILSISIAAYNVADYLRETLESLVIPEILGELEIFIVDDGATDNTFQVAQHFEQLYPNTFHAVHKKNGGYGSTVNWSIQHATGKYFKLLDGDDWVNPPGLTKLVQAMKQSESDCFISNALQSDGDGEKRLLYPYLAKENGKVLTPAQLTALSSAPVSMWGVAFMTKLLREDFQFLPEHCLYTDQIYVMNGLVKSKSFEILNDPVYIWRLGRDEQSNSKRSITNHYEDILKVNEIVNKRASSALSVNSNFDKSFVLRRCAAYYSYTISMLCILDHNKTNFNKVLDLERRTKRNYPVIYTDALKAKRLKLLRRSAYLYYWFS